jgi:hypothetical protein
MLLVFIPVVEKSSMSISTYRDYRHIQTGVRAFQLVNILPAAEIPQYITVDH